MDEYRVTIEGSGLIIVTGISLCRFLNATLNNVSVAKSVGGKLYPPPLRERLATALRASQALQRTDAMEVREDIHDGY